MIVNCQVRKPHPSIFNSYRAKAASGVGYVYRILYYSSDSLLLARRWQVDSWLKELKKHVTSISCAHEQKAHDLHDRLSFRLNHPQGSGGHHAGVWSWSLT